MLKFKKLDFKPSVLVLQQRFTKPLPELDTRKQIF